MSKENLIIAPSLLSADPLNYHDEIKEMERLGAHWHHIDVMDGHFVPQLTFGLPIIAALKKVSTIPLDVHIMVTNPDATALDYVKAGADILTFHIEASTHPHRTLQQLKAAGAKAGIAINPGTPLTQLEWLLPFLSVINVMSVNPGFGGQSFISTIPQKIIQLQEMLEKQGLADQVVIEVDGGINEETAKLVYAAGARAFVAGNFLYKASDRGKAMAALKKVSTNFK